MNNAIPTDLKKNGQDHSSALTSFNLAASFKLVTGGHSMFVTVYASTSVSAIHLCGETYEVVFAIYASCDFVTGSRRSQNVSTATAEEKVSC